MYYTCTKLNLHAVRILVFDTEAVRNYCIQELPDEAFAQTIIVITNINCSDNVEELTDFGVLYNKIGRKQVRNESEVLYNKILRYLLHTITIDNEQFCCRSKFIQDILHNKLDTIIAYQVKREDITLTVEDRTIIQERKIAQ